MIQLMAEARSNAGTEGTISPEITQLVDYIWEEASGRLEEVLSVPVDSIKVDKVEMAEAALLSIKRVLESGNVEIEGNY